ncbi:MAG: hypothetical protein FJ091_13040 [Deltaproteobacteria bacterium]|nr:hypothetical protein [Deltaproteobacteria bacterium]
MKKLAVLLIALSLTPLAGCATWRKATAWVRPGPEVAKPAGPDLSQGLVETSAADLTDFFAYAHGFYSRLALRRFNDRNTFMDPKLGAYFRTESAYADFYANMTGQLRWAHFKRLRPLAIEIVEVRSDGPGKAVVTTRFVGDNSRPLRWTDVDLVREDKWERVGERWWIAPGRI